MVLSKPALVLVDVIAWGVIHAATGYLVHRMPGRAFVRDGWLWRERRVERGGRIYVRLGIFIWKKWLPEAGDFFTGGFNKSKIPARSDDGLRLYARETRRAELGHWLAAAFAPAFFLWNPWYAATPMLLYAAVVNAPCIASQRFNRIRITRVLARRTASPPIPSAGPGGNSGKLQP